MEMNVHFNVLVKALLKYFYHRDADMMK